MWNWLYLYLNPWNSFAENCSIPYTAKVLTAFYNSPIGWKEQNPQSVMPQGIWAFSILSFTDSGLYSTTDSDCCICRSFAKFFNSGCWQIVSNWSIYHGIVKAVRLTPSARSDAGFLTAISRIAMTEWQFQSTSERHAVWNVSAQSFKRMIRSKNFMTQTACLYMFL